MILTSSFPRTKADDTCGYVREFAQSLSADFSVTVLAPPDRGSDDAIHDGIRVVRSWSPIPSRWEQFSASSDLNGLVRGPLRAQLLFLVSAFFYLLRAFALARGSTLICCHWMAPCGLMGLLCSLLLGRRFVIVEHSGALHLLRKSQPGVWLARMLVSRSRRVYVVSADLQRKLETIAPEAVGKIEVIPMGVECTAYRNVEGVKSDELVSAGINTQNAILRHNVPASASRHLADQKDMRYNEALRLDRLKVLFMGRLTRIKGTDLLIRAAAELPEADITISGDGGSRDLLTELANSLAVPARFTGHVDRAGKRQLMEECDVVVVPSVLLDEGRSEGLPVACLEAMAAGKPVVGSRSGGLTELIVDGENGFLFDTGDHKMLASKLRELHRNPALKARLGARAAATASHYDWSVIGERFRRSIARVL